MSQPDPTLPADSRRNIRYCAVVGVLVVAASLSAYHLFWRQHVKRFQAVRPGVLYRVAQPSELGMRYLVRGHGVKTVLNLRLEDDHLRRGVLAVGAATGEVESQFVEELGIRHLQWPMGREACWPWVNPWQFEAFFRLFDDPARWPVAVHCVSGRHRTGTIAALFRLEYDHWPIQRALAEMYSFSFGEPIPLQEMNLRTYVPRPQPDADQWQALCAAWAGFFPQEPPSDYNDLVRQLRGSDDRATVRQILTEQLEQGGTFALPLAARLLDKPDDPLCTVASTAADKCLTRRQNDSQSSLDSAQEPAPAVAEGRVKGAAAAYDLGHSRPTPADLFSAAALVADFGTPEEQARLLDVLRAGSVQPELSPAYRAIAAGIANRYTGNRVPFLTVLLDDLRVMPETGHVAVRYCDMAIAHLSAILDERLINVGSQPTPADWEHARQHAKAWIDDHPQIVRLGQLQQPGGRGMAR